MRRLTHILVFAGLLVVGCTAALPLGPQVPGRRGLAVALDHFAKQAAWRNWPLLLGMFYLKDHQREVKTKFGTDAARWFRSSEVGAALAGGDLGEARNLCLLALRSKALSSRFHPHYVVYYRVQKTSCRSDNGVMPKSLAQGQMEWGYETKQRRWVHLRPVK